MSDAKLKSVIFSKNSKNSFSSSNKANQDGDMNRSSSKRKSTTAPAENEDHTSEDAERINQGNSSGEDWRTEMRSEIRAAISELMGETNARPPAITPGPLEIDEDDVIEDNDMLNMVKRIEAGNRSNKTAIRLTSISKEGNRQHFMDMVEIKEKLDTAEAALKESIVYRFNQQINSFSLVADRLSNAFYSPQIRHKQHSLSVITITEILYVSALRTQSASIGRT